VGTDPFGALLDAAAQGETADKRAIAILRLKTVTPDSHCQLIYVNGDTPVVEQTLAAVSGAPVLTVTDTDAAAKGIVNFVIEQNHVRFAIDQSAALRNHLKVSSKLLQIAVAPADRAP
jgi:hypothetical protein